MIFPFCRSRARILRVQRGQLVLHDHVRRKRKLARSGDPILIRATEMANVSAAATALGCQLDGGLLRREARRLDGAHIGETETPSRQIASVVTLARDVIIHVPEGRKTQESDVHLADIQVGRDGL